MPRSEPPAVTRSSRPVDEIAYWPTDENSSEPDYEIVNAFRPAMATIPGAMLLCASRPTHGVVHCGTRIVATTVETATRSSIWQAPTSANEPDGAADDHRPGDRGGSLIGTGRVRRAVPQRRRSLRFARRSCSIASAPACTSGRHCQSTTYKCFLDPAGGSGGDTMTLAIGPQGRQHRRHRCPARTASTILTRVRDRAVCRLAQGLSHHTIEGDRTAASSQENRSRSTASAIS